MNAQVLKTASRLFALFLAALGLRAVSGADWLQFRGPDSSGVAEEKGLPLDWADGKNVAWKADLSGRGLSGPIVVGAQVVVTASSGFRQDRLHVLAFDVGSGTKRWERQFWATGQTFCHPKTCVAAPTPASDGKRIFALFSSNDLICLDLEGNLLWLRGLTHDYPNASNAVGMASSPVVVGGVVVVQAENDSDSFAAGIDPETGANRWKIARPASVNWTSPVALRQLDGRDGMVLFQSPAALSGHDPVDGRQLWAFPASCAAIPSIAAAGEVLYVPVNGVTALRLDPGGAAPRLLWQSNRLSLSTASPLVYEGRVYALGESVLKCAGALDGEIVWQLRLTGPFSSSPVAADGHLYFFSEDGLGQVVRAGEKGEIAGGGDLGETILSTPAIARGALFVRSDGHLWKIARS